MDHKCDNCDDCNDNDDNDDSDDVGIKFAANIGIVSGPFIVTVGMKTT